MKMETKMKNNKDYKPNSINITGMLPGDRNGSPDESFSNIIEILNDKIYKPKITINNNLTPRYGFARNNAGLSTLSKLFWRFL